MSVCVLVRKGHRTSLSLLSSACYLNPSGYSHPSKTQTQTPPCFPGGTHTRSSHTGYPAVPYQLGHGGVPDGKGDRLSDRPTHCNTPTHRHSRGWDHVSRMLQKTDLLENEEYNTDPKLPNSPPKVKKSPVNEESTSTTTASDAGKSSSSSSTSGGGGRGGGRGSERGGGDKYRGRQQEDPDWDNEQADRDQIKPKGLATRKRKRSRSRSSSESDDESSSEGDDSEGKKKKRKQRKKREKEKREKEKNEVYRKVCTVFLKSSEKPESHLSVPYQLGHGAAVCVA